MLLRCAALLTLLLSVSKSYAQSAPGPESSSTEFRIYGKRNAETTDYVAYWGDCNDNFLFLAYVGDDCKLMAGAPGTTPGSNHYSIQVYENGVATTFKPSVASGDVVTFNFTAPGLKEFLYTDLYSSKTWTARIVIHKKITKMWLEAEPICVATHPVGEPYKFKLRTEPERLEDIFTDRTIIERSWDGYDCEPGNAWYGQLTFNMISATPIHYEGAWPSVNVFRTASVPPARLWPESPATGGGGEEYYISYADLSPYLTSKPGYILGEVSLFDGITTHTMKMFIPVQTEATPANFNNGSAFAISEYDKTARGATSGHTAEPFGTLDAPASEVWTPTDNPMVREGYGTDIPLLRIKDKLVIGKGQRLKIKDMIIEMGKDAQIIVQSDPANVQEAGYLELDHTTIRAYRECGNEQNLWQGIVLQGSSSQSQEPIGGTFGKRWQGMLYMSNNSVISDARVAVRTYNPAAKTSRAGGIVYAYNSTFSNNLLAVDMAPYKIRSAAGTPAPYLSRFDNCTFTAADNSIKPYFEGFINAAGVNGVTVYNTDFNTQYGTTMLGYGIQAIDAAVNVSGPTAGASRSRFSGLREGISAAKAAYIYGVGLQVYKTAFEQNYTGIYSKGILNPAMTSNTFAIPERPVPALAGRNCTGINIETGSNYVVKSNTFHTLVGSPGGSSPSGNNAVLVWNTGSADNEVKDNYCYNLAQGMISNYINRNNIPPYTGLQFTCNAQDNNVGTCIAALGANPAADGMNANQGSNTRAAGNTFAHKYYDIYNPATQVGAVNYYYNPLPVNNPTLNFGSVSKSSTDFPAGCASTTLPWGGTGGTTTGGPFTPVPYTGLSSSALREVLVYNINGVSTDYTAQNRSTLLHSYLSTLADAYSDLSRVELYLEEGKTTEANTLYNGIVASRGLSGNEATEFTLWGRKLLDVSISLQNEGKAFTDLSTTQVATLADVAANATMWAKVRAQDWLQAYDGRTEYNTFLYPDNGGSTQRTADEEGAIIGQGADEAVYPNPARHYIEVRYTVHDDKATDISFELRDLSGRLLMAQAIGAKGTQRIALPELAAGLYFYTIREQNAVTLTGKLIKQ